jgi:Rod binding domain-containing protein
MGSTRTGQEAILARSRLESSGTVARGRTQLHSRQLSEKLAKQRGVGITAKWLQRLLKKGVGMEATALLSAAAPKTRVQPSEAGRFVDAATVGGIRADLSEVSR